MGKYFIAVLIGAAIPGCSDPTPPLTGDTARGRIVFETAACAVCHTIEGISTGSLGPELTHIATIAASRRPGMGAEAYIHESIVTPSAFVVPGYPNGQMPQDFGSRLSEQQLIDLVTFLMSLD